jgi:hypothetical protein
VARLQPHGVRMCACACAVYALPQSLIESSLCGSQFLTTSVCGVRGCSCTCAITGRTTLLLALERCFKSGCLRGGGAAKCDGRALGLAPATAGDAERVRVRLAQARSSRGCRQGCAMDACRLCSQRDPGVCGEHTHTLSSFTHTRPPSCDMCKQQAQLAHTSPVVSMATCPSSRLGAVSGARTALQQSVLRTCT